MTSTLYHHRGHRERGEWLSNLDRVIEKRSAYGFKPMRHAVRHDDHVAFDQLTRVTTVNARAANFVRCDLPGLNRGTASHKSCRAFHYINDVRIERVNLSLPGLISPAGVNHVIPVCAIE